MVYNGIEAKEFTSDKSVVFDPPKWMPCWDKEVDSLIYDTVVEDGRETVYTIGGDDAESKM